MSSYVKSWPSLYLFAFDSIERDTCAKHINSFYEKNGNIPYNRRPRAIIVNKKFSIAQINYEDATPNETVFYPQYQKCELNEDNQGAPLFWMIREISKGLTWLDGMYLDFGEYYKAAYG